MNVVERNQLYLKGVLLGEGLFPHLEEAPACGFFDWDFGVLGATLLAGSELTYTMGNLRYAYLAPALGVVTVNNQRLEVGDGIAASDEPTLTIAAEADAEIVLVVTN